jgi:DNA-binding response OmpR family regulator
MSVATPRVVVVSESRITRRVVEMTFADQPLQLAVFAAGQDAVDDWQTRPPAVLIADIALQSTDGYALARELRAHAAGQKSAVLLLAGQSDTVDDAAVADAQVSAVLRKPLDSHQLIDAVRQALRTGPPPPVAVAQPVSAAAAVVAAAGSAVAVAEPEPLPDDAGAAATREAQVAADDVALLLGRESVLDGDTTAGAWVDDTTAAADGLADTFHALLEVEQGIRPAAAPASALGDDDVDRIALRVAAVVATDATLAARLEASIIERLAPVVTASAERAVERLAADAVDAVVDRVVRDLAAPIVEAAAHAAVRDEIARMRSATRTV